MGELIKGNSVYDAWVALLTRLSYYPEHHVEPRGVDTKEITGVMLEVRDMRSNIIYHPARNINYRFMVAEWLWMAFAHDEVGILTQYNGQMGRFSDDGVKLAGAYGPRLAKQWDYVIRTLRADHDSRQAVATIWTPNPEKSRDIPCTIALQFLVRDGRLNLIVTMRSSDVWLGVPYDAFSFSMLANSIAGELGLQTGSLIMQLGSSHLYSTDADKIKALLQDTDVGHSISSPALYGFPPADLETVLERPDQPPPPLPIWWVSYAHALTAGTWSAARAILEEIDEK